MLFRSMLPLDKDIKGLAQKDPLSEIYHYSESKGSPVKLDRSEVLHFTSFSTDGLRGIPPLTMFRESMGLTISANKYAEQYFRKGGHPLGFLTKPNRLGENDRKTLQQEWMEFHGGLDNAHNVGVLSGGLDWKNIGLSNNDAQLLGLRQFQKYEMAQIFRVPPFLIGDVEQPLGSIETLLIQFLIFTLLPDMKRNEGEMNMKMFTWKERHNHYLEYNAEGMLRGDAKSRAESLAIQAKHGAITIDEWRALENRNRVQYGDLPMVMASQVDTLERVAKGESGLNGKNKTSTGRDKTSQNDEQQRFAKMVKMYKKLSPEDQGRLKETVMMLNGI